MERNINSLLGYSLDATEGEIGKVEEFYFDDDTWSVRYLILKTGNWLVGRTVLIPPLALVKNFREDGSFRINLTREQIRNSPAIDTDKPVSRQQEAALTNHYPWENYWEDIVSTKGVSGVITKPSAMDENVSPDVVYSDKPSPEDVHLRSTAEVTGYAIQASDGETGHIKDFIIDDDTWQLLYLIVDIHNGAGNKKVMISVRHIREVQYNNSKVILDLSLEDVKHSEEYEASSYHIQQRV